VGEHSLVFQEFTCLIEDSNLAASPKSWIDCQSRFHSGRRRQQQLPEIGFKRFNRLKIGIGLSERTNQRSFDQAVERALSIPRKVPNR